MTEKNGTFVLTTDSDCIDFDAVQRLLNNTYWAKGRIREVIKTSIAHSLCYSLFDADKQIGFLRVITDYAVYAYLCDFVIDDAYRRKGLGQWMMKTVLQNPQLQGIKRWNLITGTAQEFYRKFGFHVIENAQNVMEIVYQDRS